eukprot:Nitzschia sp. Nitz4//scaffold44_size153857//134866//136417//NITZ4_002746-RA/size153857-augustus-gene-0.28-mRNA-1//-1//CDS//3329552232//6533//frame0
MMEKIQASLRCSVKCGLENLKQRERGLLCSETTSALRNAGLSSERLPETEQELDLAEKILSEELDKLSLVDQEKVLFDVHGLPQLHHDDPDDLNDHLEAFNREINSLRRNDAYLAAKRWNEEYVVDQAFRLRFLRCDLFDAKVAAQRLSYHFIMKRILFGEGEVLARDVHISDLSEDEKFVVESGYIQVLPTRDAAGRSVVVIAPMFKPNVELRSCHRALWYLMNAMMADPESQHKGVVLVFVNIGKDAQVEPMDELRQCLFVRSAIPKKVVGLHYCFDNEALKPLVTGMKLNSDKETRFRFRAHCGTMADVMFTLETFGIPSREFPIRPDGTLTVEWHKEWVSAQQHQEKSIVDTKASTVPHRFDVLFGRSRTLRVHTGNMRATHLVEMHMQEYEIASKFQKTEIAERIVGMIHESGGRFVKWEDGGWVEVEHEAAREKISHCFRHLRTKTTKTGDSTAPSDLPRQSLKRIISSSPTTLREKAQQEVQVV